MNTLVKRLPTASLPSVHADPTVPAGTALPAHRWWGGGLLAALAWAALGVLTLLWPNKEVGFSDWAYTIGLHHSYGHPELLLVGLEAPIAGAVIEVVARTVAEGRVIRAGDEFTLDGGLELRAHAVDDLWCGMGDWFNLGREVMSTWGLRWPESLQLVWSDAEGRYPERPGDPRWSFRQPLLTGV